MRKITIPLLALLLVLACSKEKKSPDVYYDVVDPPVNADPDKPNTSFKAPEELLKTWVKPMETHSKDASGPIYITTKGGIKLFFPAKSLVQANGTPVNGNVQFYIQEYNSKSQMLFSGVTTVSEDGRILESGGMLDIVAVQNGDTLTLADSLPQDSVDVNMRFPNPRNLDSMQGFRGVPPKPQKKDNSNRVNWRQEAWKVKRDLGQKFYELTRVNRLRMINLDRYRKARYANCDLRICVKDSCFLNNQASYFLKAFLIFKDSRSAARIPFRSFDGEKVEFAAKPSYNGPAGEDVVIVVIGICNGVLKYYKVDLIVKDEVNKIVVDSMKKIEESELKKLVGSYDN